MSSPPAERSELFIYYRADVAHAAALAGAAQHMQAALCIRHPGLSARLLCRPEAREGQHTWMEAYALPGSFHRDPADRLLVAAARRSGLTLVTADDRILAYPHVHTQNARR